MARLLFMSGPGVPSCLLLLAALSSAGATDRVTKVDVTKTGHKFNTNEAVTATANKDLVQKESKKVLSPASSKRHIRKFDFDAEFATYLGLASQADTARYLAGEADSSFRAPSAFQESPEGEQYPPLRLVPGSTPASFAYFTQIYPDEHSDGDIRIEHFSPVLHPKSSEREKARYRQNEDGPENYERSKSNYYPTDFPLYAPPTSRSYFGRYGNKQKYSDTPEEGYDYRPKSSKVQALEKPSEYDDESTPDYKMGYRHVGMYHKFHEEDLYPKKTSTEWIPLKQSKLKNKQKQEADRDSNHYDPETYHDAQLSAEDYHVRSEHDDEITRIKSNIENEPPYSTKNFELSEKKVPSEGKFRTKDTAIKGSDDFGKVHFPTDVLGDVPFEPDQRARKHKRRKKKKHHRHHHHRRPGYRPIVGANEPFSNPGRGSEFKAPTFEFRNPVNTYVSPPYSPPETQHSNLKSEPYRAHEQPFDAPKEDFKQPSGPSAPSEPFRANPENDLPINGDPQKDVSFEEPSEIPEEPSDIDYGHVKQLDDSDDDYHIISGRGPSEHTKDYDKRLPHDGKVYGSFETFDSQLDSSTNKKFDPFVQYPFDEQRKKLATVVEELIETGKSRRKK